MQSSRRKFLRKSLASAAGLAAINAFPEGLPFGNLHTTSYPEEIILRPATVRTPGESIRFSVIGLNHDHIYGMSDALIREEENWFQFMPRNRNCSKHLQKDFPV